MKTSTFLSSFGLAFLGSAGFANAVLLADFDGGGPGYSDENFGTAGPLSGQVVAGGPTGSYYHLLDGTEGGLNRAISFAATSSVNWTSATFTMDVRADRIAADGFSVAFLDTATHGISAVALAPGTTGLDTAGERGTYSNSVGVGFRTFNGTNATVNFNGAQSADTAYPLTAGEWGSLEIQMDRNPATGDILLDTTMFSETGQNGTATNVFTDYAIAAGDNMEQFRVQIAGRTGGAFMDADIDNLNITIVPEPNAVLLVGLTGVGIMLRRRRR